MTDRPEPEGPEEGKLLERAREGDRAAMGSLIARHQGVVYRFLLGFLKDEEGAADAAQETLLKAVTRLEDFRGDSAFRTWLLAIARNEALGVIRSRGRRREESLDATTPLVDGAEPPDVHALRGEEVRRVRSAMERLPEKQRLSVSLRLFDGLSFREVGEVIGSSEGAARVNYHYGVGRLREWLDADEE